MIVFQCFQNFAAVKSTDSLHFGNIDFLVHLLLLLLTFAWISNPAIHAVPSLSCLFLFESTRFMSLSLVTSELTTFNEGTTATRSLSLQISHPSPLQSHIFRMASYTNLTNRAHDRRIYSDRHRYINPDVFIFYTLTSSLEYKNKLNSDARILCILERCMKFLDVTKWLNNFSEETCYICSWVQFSMWFTCIRN